MKTINLVGYGNVGFHLAKALMKSNLFVLQRIYTRSEHSVDPDFPHLFIHDIHKLPVADITIISVTDKAIEELSTQLPFENQLVVHTSGTFSMDGLSSKNRKGVFYPLQTFSKAKDLTFSQIPLCLETEYKDDYSLLESLAKALSENVYAISSEQRQNLHVTAVFVCNFVNHLFTIGKEISDENDIPFDIFYPLIDETVSKIHSLEPRKAQTGPAIREDYATINKHLLKISNDNYKNIYKLLTNSIIQNGKKF